MERITAKIERVTRDVFVNVVTSARDSIVEGSAVTGAPGQPVDTGNLRGSWQTVLEGPTRALIGTTVDYAGAVEDGVGPHGPRTYGKSGIGGSHSRKLTVAGMQRIVDAEVRKAVR